MSEYRTIPLRSIVESMIICSMTLLSPALFVCGILAYFLLRYFHGYLEFGSGNSSWVYYFTIGGHHVDGGAMLVGFILAFILFPVALGVGLAFCRRLPRCQSGWSFFGSVLGLGFVLAVALAFNLYVAFIYFAWHWNSSEPF